MMGIRTAAYAAIVVAWVRQLVQKVMPHTMRIEVPRKHRGNLRKCVMEDDTIYVIVDGMDDLMKYAVNRLVASKVVGRHLFAGKVRNIEGECAGTNMVHGWPPSWSPGVCLALKTSIERMMDNISDVV